MIYILDTVALVTALAVLHMTPKLWIISGCLLAGVFVIISIFLLLLIFIITLNVLYIFCHNLSFILPCNLYYRKVLYTSLPGDPIQSIQLYYSITVLHPLYI